jgi:hypothetical protein
MYLLIPRPLRFVTHRRASRVSIAWRSLLVAAGLVFTVSLASAFVADPLWIHGAYDDVDHDALIVTAVGTMGTAALLGLFLCLVGTLASPNTAWCP